MFVEPTTELGEPFVARFSTRWRDEWVLSGTLQLVDDRLSISSLSIDVASSVRKSKRSRQRRPDEFPATGVTADLLREVPLGKLLDQARLALWAHPAYLVAQKMAEGAAVVMTSELRQSFETAENTPAPRKRGRPSLGDDYYRQLALQYLDLLSKHGSRDLLEKLGELQDPPRERDTMRDHVRRATLLGFLGPATPGRGGRSPGPRLLEEQQ